MPAATVTQIKSVTSSLAEYHKLLEASFVTPSVAVPSFEDYLASLEVPNVLVDAIQSENRSASYSTGALTDVVHRADAIKREMNIRTKSKAAYFSDAAVDTGQMTEFYGSMYAKYLNYLRRTTPEQASS